MEKDKNCRDRSESQIFKDSWKVDTALYVVRHPTVDAKIWSDAVEWLLLFGPEEIKEVLLSASMYATVKQFPDLKTVGCTADGNPCYDVAEMARSLNIDIEEARQTLRRKESSHGVRHGFDSSETTKIQ
ncbi:MAG: hypothetical protein V2I36_04450 [Desulfopila sp.]|jgi:hypothetical protein|nr:hypothetical protein [Desulfopila sp.]